MDKEISEWMESLGFKRTEYNNQWYLAQDGEDTLLMHDDEAAFWYQQMLGARIDAVHDSIATLSQTNLGRGAIIDHQRKKELELKAQLTALKGEQSWPK